MDIVREELMINTYHPLRFERYLNMGYDIADGNYIIWKSCIYIYIYIYI
jgi:hypothetical protein